MTFGPTAGAVVACVVVGTVFILFMDVRQPTVKESTAFLVATAASYSLSPELPPVMALFFSAWLIKSYPYHVRSENFSINAPHELVELECVGSPELHPAPSANKRDPASLLATPKMLHSAQTDTIPDNI